MPASAICFRWRGNTRWAIGEHGFHGRGQTSGRRHETGERNTARKYIDQLRFVSDRLLDILDRILNESKIPPIIVVQADHGPGLELNWENPSEDTFRERLSILNAYHLPDASPEAVSLPVDYPCKQLSDNPA